MTKVTTTKEYRKTSSLRNWDKNPRAIKKDKFEELKKRISRFGQFKPLIITPDGEVLGGNMRLRAYQDLGISDIWVSVVEPKTEAEKIEIALADNEEMGYYEDQALAELIAQYKDEIDLTKYSVHLGNPINLDELLGRFGPDPVEDEAPPLEDKAVSVLGGVYQLGRHRVGCLDATVIKDVELLMNGQKADLILTDPPYGVAYVGKTGDALKIDNDAQTPQQMHDFWVQAFLNMNAVSKMGCSYYCASSQGGEMMMMMMMMSLFDSGFLVKQQIIWKKNTIVMGHSDYQFQHEPLFYGWKKDGSHKFYGDRTQSSVWEVNKPSANREHPTMKPVELFVKPVKNSSKEDDIVLDLFGGSGTTVIACEQTNRIAYVAEIDPKYVDVIRKRYSKFIDPDNWESNWQEMTPTTDK